MFGRHKKNVFTIFKILYKFTDLNLCLIRGFNPIFAALFTHRRLAANIIFLLCYVVLNNTYWSLSIEVLIVLRDSKDNVIVLHRRNEISFWGFLHPSSLSLTVHIGNTITVCFLKHSPEEYKEKWKYKNTGLDRNSF